MYRWAWDTHLRYTSSPDEAAVRSGILVPCVHAMVNISKGEGKGMSGGGGLCLQNTPFPFPFPPYLPADGESPTALEAAEPISDSTAEQVTQEVLDPNTG